MEGLIFTYKDIILEFLFELYVFYTLITWKLNRASRFWHRALVGLAVILILGFGVAAVYQLCGQTVAGRIGVYLFLFAATMVHVWLCFEEPFSTVLFCCSVAYAAQNLCYKLHLMAWCLGLAFRLYDSWGSNFNLYYRILYYIFFAAVAAAVYFLFIRPQVRHISSWRMDYRLLAISVITLIITVILCSIEDIYFAKLSVGAENVFDRPEYGVLRQTGNLFSVACCSIVLLLASRTVEQRELKQEVEYLQHAIRQSERQYEISRDTIELINIKCHDIRYKLGTLAAQRGALEGDAMADLQESISIYDARIETGNQLLDVLLTEKSLYCEQNGINLSCMADGEKLDFMEGSDLYCLFGNVLDNALEAVKAIGQRERRVINLVVKTRGDMLIIQADNYFDGSLTFQDGLPVTTKEDKGYHGFGMRSIRMIVHKYEGELTTYISGDVFHLNILFSGSPAGHS